ncbi:Sterol-4-alpha-carboxylate 3-dehydrogenase, decarboxylating [Seminavis robusta]|uniref:Sterol-4-alpha-carboxylate 3-dehydrogenase, decarboxylating n=1 Tax=Seminavis robusta TaxID=568900 RepID=A0A9N8EFQ3_9STRA|nr:Sterol-4-alpha-carboxylate 3-dehydrogenase, decarboxylating [Seminavis robusta]|eukprot:Sro1057_g236240.1 Sterol-4-alpha-carboxylate 3-dehydrogenase, decarboxylating (381) ;mRNA; f:12159-13440
MAEEKPGFKTAKGCTALVTGSSGLCGARLVEMLLERGASTVICFDITKPDAVLEKRFADAEAKFAGKLIHKVGRTDGDLTSDEAVEKAFQAAEQVDVVFHIAALVGPFHKAEMYEQVNLHGTNRIIANCKKYKVTKLVYSSSPSTRFTGADIEGLREDQMEIPKKFLALYAETKAQGEIVVEKALDPPNLYTISVAPHQVYGPHDNLFLPNLLEAAGNGRLRIFGDGRSKISICYVDNYAHGLMCGADALYDDSPALAKLYIITDGPYIHFWKFINEAIVAMGFQDLYTKFHLPVWLLYGVAYICNVIGAIIGKKFKLSPFSVCMLTIHRWFSIDNAIRDLKYEPLFKTEEAWPSTIEWFKENWLPKYLQQAGKQQTEQV